MRIIPYLDHSLCGMSLKLGTYIIYYFYLIMQIVHVYQDRQAEKGTQPKLIVKLLKTLGLNGTNMLVDAYAMLDTILLIFALAGIHSNHDLLMLPYLVFSAATCASIFLIGFKCIIVEPVVSVILTLLSVLFYYLFTINYNCYEKIKAENERPQILIAA